MTTLLNAPIDVCFEMSLDIEIELKAARHQSIRAVAGVTAGVMRSGDIVTWEAKQFGIWLRHTTLISCYERPIYFQDSMVRGIFRSFVHDHFFTSLSDERTEMRDVLTFSSPILLLGVLSERLIGRSRLVDLLTRRNEIIKSKAERIAHLG